MDSALLPKVQRTQDCAKHRTIILVSHTSKALLEVLLVRLSHYITPQISGEQFGFVPGKGTADAILAPTNVIEKQSNVETKNYGSFLWIIQRN